MPGIDIISNLSEVGTLTDWLAEIARLYLDQRSIEDLQIAAAEAVNNIILHAYRGQSGKPINVSFEIAGDHVSLVLRDRGVPLPSSASLPEVEPPAVDPSRIEALSETGFGLALIRKCVDDLRYQRVGTTNELSLLFYRNNLPRRRQ